MYPRWPWRETARKLSRALLLLSGLAVLVGTAVYALGGLDTLWYFTKTEPHRFTAMAMLTGTLRMRGGISAVLHDEQVYNGAVYTNWGFGVPLLELPFHAIAGKMRSLPAGFFPDRAIYFFYVAAMIPVLWAAIDRLLAMRAAPAVAGGSAPGRRHALSWAATLLALTWALYPLMACRFIVYEQTICYMMVFELLALSAYVFTLGSTRSLPVVAMAAASGVGLLVRPTGLVFMAVWGALILLDGRDKRARVRAVAIFAAAAAPFVAFWMYTNLARTGSLFGLGYSNSLPWLGYHVAIERFGSRCVDGPVHAVEAAARLFASFFIANYQYPLPYMQKCHFDFELRPPGEEGYNREAFFGMPVLLLLAAMLGHHLVRKERRLAVYVPYAAFALLFASYVLRGQGFAWRYVGDFWPLVLLACAMYARTLPAAADRVLGLRLAVVMVGLSVEGFWRYIGPAQRTIEILDDRQAANMREEFERSRYATDPELPSRIACGDEPMWPWDNGRGWGRRRGIRWNASCSVDTYTNVFLGVPRKADGRYEIRLRTQGINAPTLRVYVNGRTYTAHRDGDTYTADVDIEYDALTSPIVMATVQWSRALDPPQGKMLLIELV